MPDITKVATELAEKVKAGPRLARIDVSRHFGEPEGTTVWEYAEPTIPVQYRALADAAKAHEKYPDLTPELCANVAGFALTHRAPTLPQGMNGFTFYANLARGNARLWDYLMGQFAQVFPETVAAAGVAEAVDEAKKNSTEPASDTSSPSASKNSTATRRK